MIKEREAGGQGPPAPALSLVPHSPRLLIPPSLPSGLLNTEQGEKVLRGAKGHPMDCQGHSPFPRADSMLASEQVLPLGLT